MPDLHEVSGQWSLTFLENRILDKDGPLRTPRALAYAANFARLLDKTVREYHYARVALEKAAVTRPSKESPVSQTMNDIYNLMRDIRLADSFLFQASDHLENCLNALKRTIVFARRLRRDRGSPPIAPKLAVLSDGVARRVVDIRDAIEHIEEDIAKGKMVNSDTIALTVKSDSIEFRSKEIYFAELAAWIRELDSIARQLSLAFWPTKTVT